MYPDLTTLGNIVKQSLNLKKMVMNMIIPQYVFNRDRHQKQLSIMTICKNKVFFKSWKRLSFLSNYEGIKHIKDYWNKRNHICFEFVLQEQKISVLNIFTSSASFSLTNPQADLPTNTNSTWVCYTIINTVLQNQNPFP